MLIKDIDDEWNDFLTHQKDTNCITSSSPEPVIIPTRKEDDMFEYTHPDPLDIHISTKSKIAYLNKSVDLGIFWDIPILSYAVPSDGVIKKQIKITSNTQEELDIIKSKLEQVDYFEEHIIKNTYRIQFKDIRKVSVGMSKKDIITKNNNTKKHAFYNCFVIIMRIKIKEIYKEFHIKIFNTGKIEIPGIQNDDDFHIVLDMVVNVLKPLVGESLELKDQIDTILINSNFNCGFYINREKLYDILKYKYNLYSVYDPCCSYPGIQCKCYYDKNLKIQTGVQQGCSNKVSFMIFRTGNVLIGGRIDEDMLMEGYNFITSLLKREYHSINQSQNQNDLKQPTVKKRKIKKQTILVDDDELCC